MKIRLCIGALLADVTPDPGPVPLVNVGSLMCFEPTAQDGHTDWAGLPIQQSGCFGSSLQEYTFVKDFLDKGFSWWCPGCIHEFVTVYFIKNQRTGLCMDARDGAKTDGSVVQQWTCKGINDRSMVWYVERGDFPGAYKIRNVNSNLCLDVRSGSHDAYAQLQQYHCTSNNAAQNFWQTILPDDLNGDWTDGTRTAHIYEGDRLIKIDMSDFGRPYANGSHVVGGATPNPDHFYTIKVTFPDDKTYTGEVQFSHQIRWSNGSVWTRKP